MDYKNGKIYVIRNHINDKVYVGSTTQSLAKRFGEHKSAIKQNSKKKKHHIHYVMEDQGIENFYIELVENYPCSSKEELNAREGYFIRQYDAVKTGYNKLVAGRSKSVYRIDNKQIISEKASRRVSCDCGSEVRTSDKARHERSLKHQNYIKSI